MLTPVADVEVGTAPQVRRNPNTHAINLTDRIMAEMVRLNEPVAPVVVARQLDESTSVVSNRMRYLVARGLLVRHRSPVIVNGPGASTYSVSEEGITYGGAA
jgi:predicted ATPase